MNKNKIAIVLAIIALIIISIGIFFSFSSNTNININEIPTTYICQVSESDNGILITNYRTIKTDKLLSVQSDNYKLEYKYNNENQYREAKINIIQDLENNKYEYNDKDMIISITRIKNIELLEERYYYTYINYLDDKMECNPKIKESNYEFVCTNDESEFNLITDNKLMVIDIKNNNKKQLLLDKSSNIQKIWINKYIELLDEGYKCKLK